MGFTLLHWRNDEQEGAVKAHEVGQQGRLRKQGHELSSARQYEARLLPISDLSSWILTVALTVGACKILQMGKSVLVYALISFTHCLGTTVTEKEMIFSMNQKLGVRSNYPSADREPFSKADLPPLTLLIHCLDSSQLSSLCGTQGYGWNFPMLKCSHSLRSFTFKTCSFCLSLAPSNDKFRDVSGKAASAVEAQEKSIFNKEIN